MPQFGGASEKCTVCNKTVYLTEKIVVEDKEDKKTFHKTCLKCAHCNVTLTLGNYASMQGIFYCKPHFKQLFATKGNYDEGFGKDKHTKNWTPQAVTAPSSFVPVDKDDAASAKKETPSSIASKFGKTSLNTEKCHACNKTVYATEKTVIEDKEDKKVFHKTCLKCAHCNVVLSLGNYASMQGVFYCKPHFKQLFAAKGNYDEGFGKEKASSKWEPQAVAAPTSFVPVDKDEAAASKKDTPSSIASKFNKGTTGVEKCEACGKTVYLTERLVVEDKEDKKTFHKTCLKCAHCNVTLTLGNYASMKGVFYCKPHFKQLFAAKGNYDEGFGKEKLTKKWQDKEGGEASEETAVSSRQEDDRREAEQKREQEVREREERERREREEREKEAELERQLAQEKEEKEEQEREERARAERRRQEEEEREREEEEERARQREEREREEREREERELEEREREREREEQEQEERRRELEREESETRAREEEQSAPKEEEEPREEEPREEEEPQHHLHSEDEPVAEAHHEEEPAVESSEPAAEEGEEEPHHHIHTEDEPVETHEEPAAEEEAPQEHTEEVSEERSEEVSDE